LEESSVGLIDILSWNLPAGAEENHKKKLRISAAPAEI
jgi:hypothetical protein